MCEVCGINPADDTLKAQGTRTIRLFVCAGCGYDIRQGRSMGFSPVLIPGGKK